MLSFNESHYYKINTMTIAKYSSYSYKYKVHIRKKRTLIHNSDNPTIQCRNSKICLYSNAKHSFTIIQHKTNTCQRRHFSDRRKTFSTAHRATSTTDRRKPAKKTPHRHNFATHTFQRQISNLCHRRLFHECLRIVEKPQK